MQQGRSHSLFNRKKTVVILTVLTLLFSSHYNKIFAQIAPAIKWQKKIGGTKNDVAKDVVLNPDGTMLIAGYSFSNDRDVSGHHGSLDTADGFIAKLDANGNLLWQRTLGGTNDDRFVTILASPDGNYFCLGNTQSKDGDLNFNINSYVSWIVKIDPNGNTIWNKCYESLFGQQGISNGIITSDSALLIAGLHNGHSVVKIDLNGNIIWQVQNGGDDIIETNDHNYLLAAYGENTYYALNYVTLQYDTYFGSVGRLDVLDKNTGATISGDSIQIGATYQDMYNYAYEDFDPIRQTDYWEFPYADGFSLCRRKNGIFTSSSFFSPSGSSAQVIANNTASAVYPNTSTSRESLTDGNASWSIYSNNDYDFSPHRMLALTDSTVINVTTNSAAFYIADFTKKKNGTVTVAGTYSGTGFNSIKAFPNNNEFIAVGNAATSKGDQDCWIVHLIDNNTITGNVFLDKNNNGIKDPGEPSYDNAKIQSTKYGVTQYSIPSEGSYTNIVDTGTYFTSLVISDPNYHTTNPGKTSVFNSPGLSDTINFPVTVSTGITNYAITMVSLEPPRPGLDEEFVITYSNKGTDTLSNKLVSFVKDNRSQLGYSTPAPSVISGDTLSWNINQLIPGASGQIKFYLKLDPIPLLNVNDTFVSKAYIDSTGDISGADNVVLLRQQVVGSFDPNDKQESHGGFITAGDLIKDNYLTYTIRFQNKGNETVDNIIIRDTLDKLLDGTSVEIAAASNPFQFTIQNGKYLTWTFDGINLPDSAANDSLSKGYISYRVKPVPAFAIGDTILNGASIYFDYNPAVATNTQVTIFKVDKDVWTGAKSTAWEDISNWSLSKVPDLGTDVYINAGMINYPVINSNAVCRAIYVNPAASIQIASGNLNVIGN